MDFLAHIEATRDNGARTRNARLAAIKSFMRFVEHRVPSVLEQSLRILAIPSKKVDVPLITYLSIAETEAILNAPDLRTRSGIRLTYLLAVRNTFRVNLCPVQFFLEVMKSVITNVTSDTQFG
jgi:site-specific recombinase XerD